MSINEDDGPHAVEPCPDCGFRHERMPPVRKGSKPAKMPRPTCSAHTYRDGVKTPCMNWRRKGTTVCAQRHGRSQVVIAAAKRNREQEEAERRLARALVNVNPNPQHANPLEGLLWEVAMSAQAVEWLAEQVGELSVPDPQGGDKPLTLKDILREDEHTDRLGRPIIYQDPSVLWGPDHEGDGAPHVLWVMWNQERERHVKICSTAIKAGVSERMIALAEQQGTIVVRIINHMLDNMGLTEEARMLGRKLASDEMRRLHATMTPLEAASRPA